MEIDCSWKKEEEKKAYTFTYKKNVTCFVHIGLVIWQQKKETCWQVPSRKAFSHAPRNFSSQFSNKKGTGAMKPFWKRDEVAASLSISTQKGLLFFSKRGGIS